MNNENTNFYNFENLLQMDSDDNLVFDLCNALIHDFCEDTFKQYPLINTFIENHSKSIYPFKNEIHQIE